VVDQQQDHSAGEQEEDVLREAVRGRRGPHGIRDRRDHEEGERRPDQVPGIEGGPLGIDHVRHEEGEEEKGVRKGHRGPLRSGGPAPW